MPRCASRSLPCVMQRHLFGVRRNSHAMRWLLICQSSLHAATVQNLSHLQTSSMLCPVFKVSADFLRALRVLVLWRRVPLIDACLFTTVLWPVRDGVLERTAF